MRFADVIEPMTVRKHPDRTLQDFEHLVAEHQRRHDERFWELARERGLRFWQPGDPIPTKGARLLVGFEPHSRLDLGLLDEIDDWLTRRRVGSGATVEAFDTSLVKSQSEWEPWVPGVAPLFQTPVVGRWEDGVLVASASGKQGRDLAHSYLRDHAVV